MIANRADYAALTTPRGKAGLLRLLSLRRPNWRVIALMWLMTAAAWYLAAACGYLLLGAIVDFGATALAVTLLCMRAPWDKIHGGLKLAAQFALVMTAVIILLRHGLLVSGLRDFATKLGS